LRSRVRAGNALSCNYGLRGHYRVESIRFGKTQLKLQLFSLMVCFILPLNCDIDYMGVHS